jgi:hypothetical protein
MNRLAESSVTALSSPDYQSPACLMPSTTLTHTRCRPKGWTRTLVALPQCANLSSGRHATWIASPLLRFVQGSSTHAYDEQRQIVPRPACDSYWGTREPKSIPPNRAAAS